MTQEQPQRAPIPAAPQNRKLYNLSWMLKMICTGVAVTRTGLAQSSKYSKMTITNMVNELIALGYVQESEESDNTSAGQGRKPAIIELTPDAPLVAGIYIGRDECEVVLSTLNAEIVRRKGLPIKDGVTEQGLLEGLLLEYHNLTNDCGRRILGLGVASIGPVDVKAGKILNPPNFYGLHDLPVVSFFQEKTGLPVAFRNNMDGCVLAEKLFGQGRTYSNLIYLGVMNGIGAGVITNNHLLNGSTGICGEVGHTTIQFNGPECFCGRRGCLELYASLPVIVRQTRTRMLEAGALQPEQPFDWDILLKNARESEPFALHALEELAEYLSVGITDMINLLDCDVVFLGHEIARAKGLLETSLMERVNRINFSHRLRKVNIFMSSFGENAPQTGSVALALYQVFKGQIPLEAKETSKA